MTWQDWVFVAWVALSIIATTFMIGKPRKPITHGDAIIINLINVAIAAMVISK